MDKAPPQNKIILGYDWKCSQNPRVYRCYLITYTFVAIIVKYSIVEYPTYEALEILVSSLLDKTPVNQLLTKQSDQDVKELLYNQLKIF